MLKPVRFAQELDVDYKGLQYINGSWERAIDLRLYHVGEIGQWFRPNTWAVFRFAGADTAALGGGTCWYDQITKELDSEREAIVYMSRMEEPL